RAAQGSVAFSHFPPSVHYHLSPHPFPTRRSSDLFMSHARAIRNEKAQAAREGREPRVAALLQSWGGAMIAYRKRLVDSPSYTLRSEEHTSELQSRENLVCHHLPAKQKYTKLLTSA